jgi:hypothetical protein
MIFFTSDGARYEGMDQDTVTRLRTELGLTTTYISNQLVR